MATKGNDTEVRTRTPRPTAARLEAIQTQVYGLRRELKDTSKPELHRAYVTVTRALDDLSQEYANTQTGD